MKKHCFIGCLSLAFFACGSAVQPDHTTVTPRSLATASSVSLGPIEQSESVPATTVYLQSTTINAPITGYITQVLVRPGDPIRPGQLLYIIESREKKALGQWPTSAATPAGAPAASEQSSAVAGQSPGAAGQSSTAANRSPAAPPSATHTPPYTAGQPDTGADAFGVFKIVAPTGGYITRMDQQQPGTFVTEGLQLCVVADPATIRFQLDIPFEEIALVRQNPVCRIELPDGSRIRARLSQPLTKVNTGSQAAPYLALPEDHRFLPEGLIATARLITREKKDALLLPNAAILSDELMRHFWVMRLETDSIAIKVPITIGLKNDSLTEAISADLRPGDRVLVQGNYGLPDTAMVTLSNKQPL